MENELIASDIEHASEAKGPPVFRPILYCGIAVGVLDGIAATLNTVFRGVSPIRVFQYVASGVLGRSAFEGGLETYVLGLFFHFVVAFGASTVFVLASRAFPFLNRAPLITGPIYGVCVYFFMTEVVSAFSNVSKGPRTLSGTIIGVLIHIFFVGLPVAVISSRYSKSD